MDFAVSSFGQYKYIALFVEVIHHHHHHFLLWTRKRRSTYYYHVYVDIWQTNHVWIAQHHSFYIVLNFIVFVLMLLLLMLHTHYLFHLLCYCSVFTHTLIHSDKHIFINQKSFYEYLEREMEIKSWKILIA